jgi:hypothetical protein
MQAFNGDPALKQAHAPCVPEETVYTHAGKKIIQLVAEASGEAYAV